MNRVFGKKKAPKAPPPTLDDASGALGSRAGHMDVKIAALDKELKGYKDKIRTTRSAAAKKNLQKRAMDVLKRKRMYESQRDTLMGQQFNLDQAAFGIESAKATVDSVAAMKSANVQLKKAIQKDLQVDAVDDLADDMAELMEEMNEINEALGRNFTTPDDITEDDLDAELDMLEDEFEEEDLVGDSTPSYLQDSLPSNPTGKPHQQDDEPALAGLAGL